MPISFDQRRLDQVRRHVLLLLLIATIMVIHSAARVIGCSHVSRRFVGVNVMSVLMVVY